MRFWRLVFLFILAVGWQTTRCEANPGDFASEYLTAGESEPSIFDNISVRLLYERERFKIKYDDVKYWGFDLGEEREEKLRESKVIEVILRSSGNPGFEVHGDFSFTQENFLEDWAPSEWNTAGNELGLGIRSPLLTVPGLAPQWGARIYWYKMHQKGIRESIYGKFAYDHDVEGVGTDLHLGLEYGIQVGKGLLLVPEAGYLFKFRKGRDRLDFKHFLRVAEADEERETSALYGGLKLYPENSRGLGASVAFWTGGDGTNGLLASLTIPFRTSPRFRGSL